jgi:hypothetical protein
MFSLLDSLTEPALLRLSVLAVGISRLEPIGECCLCNRRVTVTGELRDCAISGYLTTNANVSYVEVFRRSSDTEFQCIVCNM